MTAIATSISINTHMKSLKDQQINTAAQISVGRNQPFTSAELIIRALTSATNKSETSFNLVSERSGRSERRFGRSRSEVAGGCKCAENVVHIYFFGRLYTYQVSDFLRDLYYVLSWGRETVG